MTVTHRSLRLLVLALAAAALSVATSSAQNFHGKIDLPFETQIGSVVLQPGTYILQAGRFQGGQRLVTVRPDVSGGSAAMILVESQNPSHAISRSDLICVREGGVYVVRSLEIAPLGETLNFRMPAGEPVYSENRAAGHHSLLAENRGLTLRVPVSAAQ
jgi:hypothetical protein